MSNIKKKLKQNSRNCVWRKKIDIFEAIIIYLKYIVDYSLKTVKLKNI